MAGPWEAYQSEAAPWEKYKAEPSTMDSIKQGATNLAAGAIRGAGSIGATILAPADMLNDAMAGKGWSLESNRQRRAMMDAGLQRGIPYFLPPAETDSLMYKGGKLGAEVAGTAGAGGVLAKGVSMIPGVATKAPLLAEALRSGGLSLGGTTGNKLADMGLRVAGGSLSGGAAAGMVNPEDAPEGAVIGGALPVGVKAAGLAGQLLKKGAAATTKAILGTATGTGSEAVGTAYQAGKQGGTSFLDNMRGNVPMTEVLDDAKAALSKMRLDRGAEYRSGMAGVSADKTVIDFTPIEKAVAGLQSMGNYKGQVINKNSAGTVNEISDLVSQWKALDPKEFHTPEGLDALKKAISDIRDTTQFGTAARKAADSAYNAVKSEITAQAPTYSKVMRDYELASDTIKEVEKALSLGNKAAADTSMRKLQSLMRNNVNTNYGNRLSLAKQLESNGAEILPAVAGQAMSSLTPRGLQAASATGLAGAAMYLNPKGLAMLPLTSPRLVGEAAYGLGAMNRGVSNVAGASADKLAKLLKQSGAPQLTMEELAPLFAATSVLSATQK